MPGTKSVAINDIISILKDYKNTSLFALSREERKYVSDNIKYKNKFSGKRCFILGNGPSLNDYDLGVLRSEIVFCVNNFIKYEKINIIHPDFYILYDRSYFLLNKNDAYDKRFVQSIKNLNSINDEIVLFLPVNKYSINALSEYGWNDTLNISYFKSGLTFENQMKNEVNLCSIIPSMQAVVQIAILIAIYMGFSEIYLLGCEQTGIFGDLENFLDNSKCSEYAYSLSDDEIKRKTELEKNFSKNDSSVLPDLLRGHARIFELFNNLKIYCDSRNIKLNTCSKKTLLKEIPYKNFEALF